ncbi:MAG: hypothetical protein AB9869_13940 [Verrucomicrobiia bacterium]
MRKTIFVLLTCTVLLLIGYAGLRGYQVWRRSHMTALAREFIAKGNLRNSILSLKQVLRANPTDIEATRLMAELAESTGSPEAFLWRSRVVQYLPDSTEDRLALARVALGVRDLISASNALEGITVEGRNSAGFHNLAGTIAIAGGQITSAESHFAEAARMSPTNPVPRLNLAVIGLVKTNEQAVAEARATLQALSTEPMVSCQALRELLNHSLRTRQTNDALEFASRLVKQTNSTYADRLLQLDVLRGSGDPQLDSHLAEVKASALKERAGVYAMGTWLMTRKGPADALRWLDSLPAETRTNQPAAMLAADCHMALTNWPGLQADLEQQDWGELEVLRRAFLARAMREQDRASSAKTEWEMALRAAKGRKPQLTMLLNVASRWQWINETEQLLRTFWTEFPSERWAPAALAQLLYSVGRTEALLQLFTQTSKANPGDLPAKNNLAMLGLLLDAQQLKPHDLAREVYESSPTNATYVSTYAFSLYRQDKVAEALQLIEKLQPQELERPSIAAYYGVLLRASGNAEKARKYLELAAKATLLPEERRLVEAAQRM